MQQIIRRRPFIDETVVLDGFFYVDCTFINVLFLFNGTGHEFFKNPTFQNCQWILAGDALETAKLLTFLADGDLAAVALRAASGRVTDRKAA